MVWKIKELSNIKMWQKSSPSRYSFDKNITDWKIDRLWLCWKNYNKHYRVALVCTVHCVPTHCFQFQSTLTVWTTGCCGCAQNIAGVLWKIKESQISKCVRKEPISIRIILTQTSQIERLKGCGCVERIIKTTVFHWCAQNIAFPHTVFSSNPHW